MQGLGAILFLDGTLSSFHVAITAKGGSHKGFIKR